MSRMGLVSTYWPFFLSGIIQRLRYLPAPAVYRAERGDRCPGCGPHRWLWEFRTYGLIVLPSIIPGLTTLAIFLFIQWWGQFMFALIMTTTSDMFTLPVGIAMMQGVARGNLRYMMATTTLAMLPTIIVFIFFQKYLMRGVVMQLD